MIPPGVTDYPARRRFLGPGRVVLQGRAWSGSGPVERVEVGIDDAWKDAALEPAVGEFAWRGWSFAWDATPGVHELSCRAVDAAGNAQPVDQPWNVGGFANNHVQRVTVTVG
jgi:hypothetical protein